MKNTHKPSIKSLYMKNAKAVERKRQLDAGGHTEVLDTTEAKTSQAMEAKIRREAGSSPETPLRPLENPDAGTEKSEHKLP